MQTRSLNRFFWLLMLCVGLVACSGLQFRNYGAITPDSLAAKAFETYQVRSDYRYYASGAHVAPNALMGLHRNYRLNPQTLWREVPGMTPEKMKDLVENMKTRAAQVGQFQHGFALTDPQGKPIGIWYSMLEARTSLNISDDGTVRIDTPPLDTYERYERDGGSDSYN